jgi:dGTPase
METGKFRNVAIQAGNPKWGQCIKREQEIYRREDEIRSDFSRDYNRILHCTAYRRLKHKTQVFFATRNDHVCTRIEHVNHVASVSYTIANCLGLNTELTMAIATGHDLGHAPFGHAGEEILRGLAQAELGENFWHEKNSLRFIDYCETLQDPVGNEKNLNLTYGVRDGIILHCGEVDENSIFPRNEVLDLEQITKANQFAPYTWEGCIVKIADKIAYLGRDIEDALLLNILNVNQKNELKELIMSSKENVPVHIAQINNTVLMHDFIIDLCSSSSPVWGITFSPKHLNFLQALKQFNYAYIYRHERLMNYKNYAQLIMESIFNLLKDRYCGKETLNELKQYEESYPLLIKYFGEWLLKYSSQTNRRKYGQFHNKVLYQIENRRDYLLAIIDFMSGMTDNFAIRIFNELTSF